MCTKENTFDCVSVCLFVVVIVCKRLSLLRE